MLWLRRVSEASERLKVGLVQGAGECVQQEILKGWGGDTEVSRLTDRLMEAMFPEVRIRETSAFRGACSGMQTVTRAQRRLRRVWSWGTFLACGDLG